VDGEGELVGHVVSLFLRLSYHVGAAAARAQAGRSDLTQLRTADSPS
jgi:hypothetical protein